MLDIFFELIIEILEVIGVMIIVIGIVKMVYAFLKCLFLQIKINEVISGIRIQLGNHLVLTLEIFIGRDIIETLLNPSMNDIIILVVLVLLRTLLAFFLTYEAKHMPPSELNKLLAAKK